MKQLLKALNMIRLSNKPSFYWRIIYVIVQSVLPLLSLYILKFMVDSVTNGVSQNLLGFELSPVMLLALFSAIFLLNRLVGVCSGFNSDIMSQRLVDYLSDRMQKQSARLDMSYFDNPEYHDTYHRAQQESSYRPLQVLNGFMNLFGSVITISGIVVMLSTASIWIIVVMVVAVIPSFIVRLIKSRQIYAFRRENTQLYRRTMYYTQLLGGRDFAKEMRTFGLAPFFRSRFVQIRKDLVKTLLRISRRISWYDSICAVVETAALFFVTLFLIISATSGAITVGAFVMLFEAFRRGQSALVSLVGAVSGLYDNRLFVGNLFEFLDLEPTIVSPADAKPFPEVVETIEFRDITFRYPKMERDVISHFNLIAKAGEVTQIEGENGFGKTTLLKLLLRLYDTDQGAILVNGVDVRQYDLRQLRRGIGAIFQDYVRFYCTAEENIAFGDIEHFDPERVRYAAELAGVDKYIDKLPRGYQTPLGRMFDNGEELSMGQWQRIALARQLYSDAPVLIFDEPTAWMDVPSRKRFYETLDVMKANKKVIILIKHV
ncbi:MAG: ABC transporter ATP-binding protein/permease [Bacteroidales bacterium]|nr:ABC transporter ATP-binding protein/permease [Bacteroidales bacterium]